jgi:hypothetical protein
MRGRRKGDACGRNKRHHNQATHAGHDGIFPTPAAPQGRLGEAEMSELASRQRVVAAVSAGAIDAALAELAGWEAQAEAEAGRQGRPGGKAAQRGGEEAAEAEARRPGGEAGGGGGGAKAGAEAGPSGSGRGSAAGRGPKVRWGGGVAKGCFSCVGQRGWRGEGPQGSRSQGCGPHPGPQLPAGQERS